MCCQQHKTLAFQGDSRGRVGEKGPLAILGKSRTLRTVQSNCAGSLRLCGEAGLAPVSRDEGGRATRPARGGTGQIPRERPWAACAPLSVAMEIWVRGGRIRRSAGGLPFRGLSSRVPPSRIPPRSAATSAEGDCAWPIEALRRVLLPGTGAQRAPRPRSPPPRTRPEGEAAFEPNGLPGPGPAEGTF